eukprot:tig00000404_g406.t1
MGLFEPAAVAAAKADPNGAKGVEYLVRQAEARVATLEEELSRQRADAEAASINAEQAFNQLERQYIDVRKEYDDMKKEYSKLRAEHDGYANSVALANARASTLEATVGEQNAKVAVLQKQIEELSAERKTLLDNLERRKTEISTRDADAKVLTDKIMEGAKRSAELREQLAGAQSELFSSQIQVKKLESEKEVLSKHSQSLSEEISKKTAELQAIRGEKLAQVSELQKKLDTASSEAASSTQTANSYKERFEQQMKATEDKAKELQEERSARAAAEEQLKQELAAQRRLATLYKEDAEDSKKRLEELQSAVKEMQVAMRQQESGGAVAVEQAEASRREAEEKLRKTEEELVKLRARFADALSTVLAVPGGSGAAGGEVTAAAEGMPPAPALPVSTPAPAPRASAFASPARATPASEDPGSAEAARRRTMMEMSPAAATASAIQELSLVDLYTRYMDGQEALLKEKAENRRLNTYLSHILRELEQKAPLLQEQREEYARMQRMHAQIAARLETSLQESKRARAEADDLEREKAVLQRENASLTKERGDLCRQVQHLLQTLHKHGLAGAPVAAAAIVRTTAAVLAESEADAVISQQLVEFDDIAELQENNARLLKLTRKLSEDLERERLEFEGRVHAAVEQRLQPALLELQDIRDARARQDEIVKSLVRQRDMFRTLAEQSGPAPARAGAGAASSSAEGAAAAAEGAAGPSGASGAPARASAASALLAAEHSEALRELHDQFAQWRNDSFNRERELKAAANEAREAEADRRVEAARAKAELESMMQRYDNLQKSLDTQKKELEMLRKKNGELTESVIRHERAMHEANTAASAAVAGEKRLQREKDEALAENKVLRAADERAAAERAERSAEIARLNARVEGLQSMLATLQSTAEERVRRAGDEADRSRQEWSALKLELDKERSRLHELNLHSAIQARDHQQGLEDRDRKLQEAREDLARARAQLEVAQERIASLEQQLKSSDQRITRLIRPPAAARRASEAVAAAGASDEAGAAAGSSEAPGARERHLEVELARAAAELENLRAEAAQARRHVDELRALLKVSEETSKGQAAADAAARAKLEAELAEERAGRAQTEAQLKEIREAAVAGTQREQEQKERYEGLVRDLRADLEGLGRSNARLAAEAAAAKQQSEAARAAASQAEGRLGEAQGSYERELVLHAGAVQACDAAKAEAQRLDAALRRAEAQAAGAQAALSSGEAAWAEQRRLLERRAEEAEAGRRDVAAQNELLHSQLERLSAQLGEFQAAHFAGGAPAEAAEGTAERERETVAELREVVRHLRRERAIVDAKLQVASLDKASLEQQLEHANRAADALRAQLEADIASRAERDQTDAEHRALMQQLGQMNLLRESNATLREQAETAQREARRWEADAKRLESLARRRP